MPPASSAQPPPVAHTATPGGAAPADTRMAVVDALKAVASQCIVLHHLAIYGPMSEVARPLAPGLFDLLDEYGRYAVQVFLVIGGLLAARALAPRGLAPVRNPAGFVARRFLRLAPTYWAALAAAIGAAALARSWADLSHTSPAPSPWALAANVLMLQDVLDVPALSAGQWYVAIDLQLHALFVLLLWLMALRRPADPQRARWLMIGVVTLGSAVSLFGFNREPSWQIWAPYFLGAYGLGALAWWGGTASGPVERRGVAGLIIVLTALALIVDWRDRIALAGLTALLLLASTAPGTLSRWKGLGVLNGLGKISYSVFLIHYPVLLVFDAAAARWLPAEPVVHALALLGAWAASLLAGALLWWGVESRLIPQRKRAA